MIKTWSYFLGTKEQAAERVCTLIFKTCCFHTFQGGHFSRSEESRPSWIRTLEGGLALWIPPLCSEDAVTTCLIRRL